MSLALRDNLEFCITGGRAIFLDLAAGRYFALSDRHFAAFQRWISGEVSLEDGTDRLNGLVSQGILIETDGADVRPKTSISGIALPAVRFPVTRLRASPTLVAWIIFDRLLWRRRIKNWPFVRLIKSVRKSARPDRLSSNSIVLPRIIRSFEIADLIIGNHDRCLERSLALVAACRRYGLANTLVLAIQANPFAAHCWVQNQSYILNDHPDRVSMFTPILAL
ncbi:lasso peptide biosynthesis B2 protein [Sphingobium sp. H39-3-25]|uniref:lasso peptide biosynthesis B2 protein n=1 Tax=Sphingobium arseniciresistens TaxID=3030834 RepID=UPI0023B9CBF9|nr:lasso peptide biosynthesis B2 protein [Sphingobium arseniciresistens]